jgi:uncharacterized membrane-anchored protein YhcB (DUF1043 family)
MWTAIALICVAGMVTGIFTDRGKNKHNEELSDELNSLHAKMDALEHDLRKRVETIERIVTSPKEDLKRRFDHLDKAS